MEINQYKQLFDIILKYSSDGIVIVDENGKAVAYSESYTKFLGASKELLDIKNMKEILDEGWLSTVPTFKIIETKQPCSEIVRYYKTNKELLFSGVPVLDDNNRVKYVVISIRDLSELNKLEAELKDSKKLLNKYRYKFQVLKREGISDECSLLKGMIARSKKMEMIFNKIESVAKYSSNIMILGETGVGKSAIAEKIHYISNRSEGKFIKVDCASIPENLLELELFGYEKGAFTDANKEGKKGLVEMADKGTLFLDDIGEMSLNCQAKMLNVMEDKRVKRIGGTEYKNVDIRIISATNKDINEIADNRIFRRDLYYRLNGIVITLPPLRERKEDIIPLIKYYEQLFKNKYNLEKTISSCVYEKLFNYSWPGNVRELIHVVERLMLLDEDTVLSELHEDSGKNSDFKNGYDENALIPLKEVLETIEKEYIIKTLNSTRTLKEAAEKIGIEISTLVKKKQKYNIYKTSEYN